MKKITLFALTLLMGFLGMNQKVNGRTKVFDQTITWELAPNDHGGYASSGTYVPSITAPNYSIDFVSERTNQVVSSDDQYSYNSDFSPVVDGNGQYLSLTPGTNVYFRKKADYSKTQTLTVPYRPGAPWFRIDYANERTSETVSSEYRYSSNSDMSSSTTGDGSYVSLTPGTNYYFRKLGSASAFASNIQSLSLPARPAAPSFGIDYANERTLQPVTGEYDYSSSSDMSSATIGDGSYVSLIPGSSMYFRKLAISSAFASNIQELILPASPIAPNYSIDFVSERTNKVVSTDDQYSYNSDFSTVVNGNGQYLSLTPGTNVYFRKKADYSKTQTLTVPYRPGAPWFRIDYANERTSETVSSEYRYSSNSDMSSSTTGDGSYVSLTPGTNYYFRKLGSASAFASNTQSLPVPARPAAPSFGINYPNERTSIVVSNEYQHSAYSNMSSPSYGDGSYVGLIPGSYRYFRKLGSASAFASNIQELLVPVRPAAPSFGIDYPNERTSLAVQSTHEYATSADMSDATTGTGNYVAIVPGSTRYFRTNSTSSAFRSRIQTLTVPARPAAPSFGINFPNERTSTVVSNEYQHSAYSNMSSPSYGDGSYVGLIPGSYRYFRKLGSASAFASNIQELLVPVRPAAPSFGIDYPNERTSLAVQSTHEYATSANMSDATTGTGKYVAIVPGSTRYFRTNSTSSAFRSSIQTLTGPTRPPSPSFLIDFMKEEVSTPIGTGFSYSINPDMGDATIGSNNLLQVIPEVNIYFQAIATASVFASEIQTLVSPSRPGAPTVGINYANETTDKLMTSDIQYSGSSGFETAVNGTGMALNIVPGVDLYFRQAAMASSYSSEVFHLVVPERPMVSSRESGSTELYPFKLDITFFQELDDMDISKLSVSNAEMKNFSMKSYGNGETVFEGQVFASANDVISIGVPANVVDGGNFISHNFEITFTGLLQGLETESIALSSFTVYPNPGKGVFHLKFETFDSQNTYNVECSSITGKLVHVETFFGLDEVSLDLSGLSQGAYFLRLIKDKQIIGVTKLIIK